MRLRVNAAAAGAGLVVACALAACSHRFARPVNPGAPKCQESLRDALTLLLVGQEEEPEVAEAVAATGAEELAETDIGPRPFGLSSPSGFQYAFVFEDEGRRCLLHLVAWQKGAVQHGNTATYLATRPLRGCRCEK